MFKVKEYKDVLDYMKRTIISKIIIISILTYFYAKGPLLIISLAGTIALFDFMLIWILACIQAIDVTEEKNIQCSWLTRAWFTVE